MLLYSLATIFRELYLRPDGGLMFPDEATIEITGIADPGLRKRRFGWLDACWEADMTAVKPLIASVAVVEVRKIGG